MEMGWQWWKRGIVSFSGAMDMDFDVTWKFTSERCTLREGILITCSYGL